jgi:hypothetical protein
VRVRTYGFPGVLRGRLEPRLATIPTIRPRRSLSSPGYICPHFSVYVGLRPGVPGYVMFVPRCNPSRWSLGATALVALVVAGCDSGTRRNASLRPRSEKRLLSLVARARTDASGHHGSAVHAVLGEFVSEVERLKKAGQLGTATAAHLERAARATAAGAARELHATPPRTSGPTSASQTSTAADPNAPARNRTPARSGPRPAPTTKPSPPSLESGQEVCGAPRPGHLHRRDKGLGHGAFRDHNCQDGGIWSSWKRGDGG